MKVTVQPSHLKGNVHAPASKSSMQRACAAALLRNGDSIIHNPGFSKDDKAAISIIRALGASVVMKDGNLAIHSGGIKGYQHKMNLKLQCGESGLSIRMFTPLAALCHHELVIEASGSLLSRPMGFFDEIMPLLNVDIKSSQGRPPLAIKGPLDPVDIEVDGSLSSQFITGLLMAYSAAGADRVTLKVRDLKSGPYIDLTLDVMKKFGMDIPENRDYKEFFFYKPSLPGRAVENSPGEENSMTSACEYTVESDWSGGAFLLVAGAIAGPITVKGLDLSSRQADRVILDIMMQANAAIAVEAKGIKVHPGGLRGFTVDATDCPDLFPPLVALAAYSVGDSSIRGVSRLFYKESNRARSLVEEFGKLGVKITVEGEVMSIRGGGALRGAAISAQGDHRIAMACTIASLKAEGETTVDGAEAVQKSYPDFFTDLKSLGASVSLPFQQVSL